MCFFGDIFVGCDGTQWSHVFGCLFYGRRVWDYVFSVSVYGDSAGWKGETRTCEQYLLYRFGSGNDVRADDWRYVVWKSGYPVILSSAAAYHSTGHLCIFGSGKESKETEMKIRDEKIDGGTPFDLGENICRLCKVP